MSSTSGAADLSDSFSSRASAWISLSGDMSLPRTRRYRASTASQPAAQHVHEVFEAQGAMVLGVSPDPLPSHGRFREKHDLNFPLLSDEDHQVADAYGVWKEKSMYGRKFWGIERSTFLIDEGGVIVRAWRRVRPAGHAEKVMAVLTPNP